MDWLSSHFWQLFSGVGGTAIVAFLIFWLERKRRNPTTHLEFRETTSHPVTVRDSQLTGSPIASGSQINQHNYFGPATPQPVTPISPVAAPAPEAKPRPNIQMTGMHVAKINETRDGVFVERNFPDSDSAIAILIRFTNEAKAGGSNAGVFVRAALTYHYSNPVSLRIIGNWLTLETDAAKFLVDDSYHLIAGLKVAGSIAAPERRREGGGYSAHFHVVPDLKSIFVRLTDADKGDVLYEGEFQVTADPIAITQRAQMEAHIGKHAEPKPVLREAGVTHHYYVGDDGPFCQECYDSKKILTKLGAAQEWNGGIRRFCVVGKNYIWEEPWHS